MLVFCLVLMHFSQSTDGGNGNSHDNDEYRTPWDDIPGTTADVSSAQSARRTGKEMLEVILFFSRKGKWWHKGHLHLLL